MADPNQLSEQVKAVRAQILRLKDETERLANRSAWVPWAQAVAFFGATLLIAYGL
ncbi:hypothetical protein YK56LOC_60190 [Caballeronia sp. HLA56]